MNVIETLEARYLPLLNQAAARLGEKHPTFKVNVGSGSVGGATTFQGHDVYLEAFRPDGADPEPNCLALQICAGPSRHAHALHAGCCMGRTRHPANRWLGPAAS
jgi:hypothetical protein